MTGKDDMRQAGSSQSDRQTSTGQQPQTGSNPTPDTPSDTSADAGRNRNR